MTNSKLQQHLPGHVCWNAPAAAGWPLNQLMGRIDGHQIGVLTCKALLRELSNSKDIKGKQ